MTVEDIKAKIDENNSKIEESIKVNFFTLNVNIAALLNENEELRNMCDHEFEDGRCKYCYLEEK